MKYASVDGLPLEDTFQKCVELLMQALIFELKAISNGLPGGVKGKKHSLLEAKSVGQQLGRFILAIRS